MAGTRHIHDLEVEDHLYDAVYTDPDQINEEFSRVSSDLAYWNTVYAIACGDAARAEASYKRKKAEKFLFFREEIAASGARPTDEWIKSLVDNDDEVNVELLAKIDAESEKVRLYGVVDAIRAKKDMLVSLGATLRAEMDNNPAIKEERKFQRYKKQSSGE